MATGSPASPTALQSESIDLPIFEPEGRYEVLYGEVVEKPAMGVFETWIATKLSGWLLRSTGIQDHGRVVSEMLFVLDLAKDLKCRPDLAFVSYERWARTRPVPRVCRLGCDSRSGHRGDQSNQPGDKGHRQGEGLLQVWRQVRVGRLPGRGADLRLRLSHEYSGLDRRRHPRVACDPAWLSATARSALRVRKHLPVSQSGRGGKSRANAGPARPWRQGPHSGDQASRGTLRSSLC